MPAEMAETGSAAATRRHSSTSSGGTSSDDSSRQGRRTSIPVSFNSKTKVFLIPTVDEMSDAEWDATYPTAEDMHRGQRNVVESILSLRRGNDESIEDGVCHRGLEHMRNPTTVETSRAAKMTVIDAVLHEQERQWDAGIFDDVALARVAEAASRSARDTALSLAAADEAFARRYQKEKGVNEEEGQERAAVRGVLGTALTVSPPAPMSQTRTGSPPSGTHTGRPRRRASSTIPSLGGNSPSAAPTSVSSVKSSLKKNKSVDAFLDRMTSRHNRPRIARPNPSPSY